MQEGKVCLITGAARRIGAAIAAMYHAHGYRVILHYHHSAQEAQALAETLNRVRADSAVILMADLLQQHAVIALAQQAHAVWGRIDVLVNNASVFFPTHHDEPVLADWDLLMNTNARAPWMLSLACYPFLKCTEGNVVNIADIQAIKPIRDYALYAMTKASLLMMTKALAKEWQSVVRVNAVAPGPILPPEGRAAMSMDMYQQLALKTKAKKLPAPDEVAAACVTLSHSTQTGDVVLVDGGRLS